MLLHRVVITIIFTAVCSPVLAQSPNLEPKTPNPPLPVVTFDFVLEGAVPAHYSLAVEPDGKSTYHSDQPPTADGASGVPYELLFVVSEPTRKRIFDLTLALHCFQGEFEFRGGRVANMGAKTLKCTYADHESRTTYNYTTNAQLQELTTIFQDISNTLEFGRRLSFLHRFDKLGLESELKSMQEQARNKHLAELQAVAAELEKILNDQAVMNVTRRRAEQLLQLIKSDPAARAAAPQ